MHAGVSALPCVGVYVWEHVHVSAPVYVRVEARDQLVSRVFATSPFLRQSLHWTLSWSSLIQLGWPVSKATFQCWITDVRGHICLYVGARNLKSGPQDCTQELYSLGQLFRCLDFLTIFFSSLQHCLWVLEATTGWVSNFFWERQHSCSWSQEVTLW